MRTKTVVEVTNKELTDLVIEAARRAVKPGPGPVAVQFISPKNDNEGITATVTFEWGAKPNPNGSS